MTTSPAFDDFTVINSQSPGDTVYGDFERHSDAPRTSTDLIISSSLRARHPDHTLTITPVYSCNLLTFASAGQAQAVLDQSNDGCLLWRSFVPPRRRLDGASGHLSDYVQFARYHYCWQNHDFLIYIVNGDRGNAGSYRDLNQYVLHKRERNETSLSRSAVTDELITAASIFHLDLHEEILVFDQGYWQKNHELWESTQTAEWSDVILDETMKRAMIEDVEGFFSERENYREFAVPWKVYSPLIIPFKSTFPSLAFLFGLCSDLSTNTL